jgi:hypothetical protein
MITAKDAIARHLAGKRGLYRCKACLQDELRDHPESAIANAFDDIRVNEMNGIFFETDAECNRCMDAKEVLIAF